MHICRENETTWIRNGISLIYVYATLKTGAVLRQCSVHIGEIILSSVQVRICLSNKEASVCSE